MTEAQKKALEDLKAYFAILSPGQAAAARREALMYQMHLTYGISTDDLGKYIEGSDSHTSSYDMTYEELEEAYGKAVRDFVEKNMANFDPE